MSSVVIVSDQCYLLAEAINYIVINEVDDTDDREWIPRTAKQRKRLKSNPNKYMREYTTERKPYNIVINFIAKDNPNTSVNNPHQKRSSEETTTVTIRVHGLKYTKELFQHVVAQIRDQIPDEMYLNKLVEKFLTSEEEQS